MGFLGLWAFKVRTDDGVKVVYETSKTLSGAIKKVYQQYEIESIDTICQLSRGGNKAYAGLLSVLL